MSENNPTTTRTADPTHPTRPTFAAAAVYRCPDCKRAGRPDAYRVDYVFERLAAVRAFHGPDGVRRVTTYSDSVPGYPCPRCGRLNHAKPLRGKVTEEPCGAKCLAAKGPACDCACGGANHGANHR